MFPLLIPILAGAGIGALSNKKDPLKGAAIGGALGAGGGAFLGAGALGAGGGAAASAGTAATTGTSAAAPATAQSFLPAAWQANLDKFAATAKPFGDAANAAATVQGLLGPTQSTPAPQPPMGGGQSVAAPIQGILDSQGQLEQQRQAAIRRRSAGILGSTYG